MEVRAYLRGARLSPQKAGLVADQIRGLGVEKALDILTYNKTTIVIAHRLSTILNSDKIYVMDQGSVLDSGKHDELLKKSATYKNFYNRQIFNN